MALIHFEFDIDSDVHPELHAALLRIGEPAARGERLRQLAASGLVWEAVRIHGRAVVEPVLQASVAPVVTPAPGLASPVTSSLAAPPSAPLASPLTASPTLPPTSHVDTPAVAPAPAASPERRTTLRDPAPAPVPAPAPSAMPRQTRSVATLAHGTLRRGAASEANHALRHPSRSTEAPPDFIDLAIDAQPLEVVLADDGPGLDGAVAAGDTLGAASGPLGTPEAADPPVDGQAGQAVDEVVADTATQNGADAPRTAAASGLPQARAPAAAHEAAGSDRGRDLPVLIDVVEWGPGVVGQRDAAADERPAFVPVATVPHRPASQSRLKRMKDKGLFKNG